jgi:glycosyltransferase involved in cell wall biosynthesis
MALSAWWGLDGAALDFDGMVVYPADRKYGNVVLPQYAKRHQADLVIALMDAWVLHPEVFRSVPLAVWCPVDHQPCPPKVADFFRISGARAIAMSKFGKLMLEDEGLDPLYVPHGIDTNTFKPLDRAKAKAAFGYSEDSFVVGVVANNSGGMPPAGGPPRKAFPQIIMAFSAFQKQHPNAHLYLHTEMTGRPGLEHGLNIGRLLERFEVEPESVKFTDPVSMELGIEPTMMAALYNSFDVLLNPSYGEGFGIPIIEAQACGTPVIVSNWTAMPELVGAGWKVEGEPWYDPHHEAFYLCPSVGHILDALEAACAESGSLREQARAFALQYDADKVTEEHWVPTLEALGRPREVPPLPTLNREQRRALVKSKKPKIAKAA